MALRLRRGTDAERQSITPKQGELLYVTDTGLLYVGDGTTQGGNRVSGTIQDDESPTLSANLDLNGNDIVGTGNINIDGNITATGNINIGDGVEDNVIVGGTISSDLVPTTDTAFDLGSTNFRWQNAHLTGLFVDGNISAGSITVGDIYADNSTLIFNSLTGTLTGDFSGNLISEDQSTIIIDASNNNGQFDNLTSETIFVDNLFPLEVSSSYIESTILETGEIDIPSDGKLAVKSVAPNQESSILLIGNEDQGLFRFIKDSSINLGSDANPYGTIRFERNDSISSNVSSFISGGVNYLAFGAHNDENLLLSPENRLILTNGLFGVGTTAPSEKLHVDGNALVSGNLTAGSVTADILADDSNVLLNNITQILSVNQVKLNVLDEEPSNPEAGTLVVADGVGFDPALTGEETLVVYLNNQWQQLI